MTFLEMAQLLRQECSVSGDGPSAVTSQSGEYGRLINWIQQAHEEIQNAHYDWKFLWNSGSFDTIAAQALYDLTSDADMGGVGAKIDDFAQFVRYTQGDWHNQNKVLIDGDHLDELPWSEYRAAEYPTASGKPYLYMVRPDNKILFYPTPDAVYDISFEYYRTGLVLAAASDSPLMPPRFHRAVVNRAMMYYGNYESADEVYKGGMEAYGLVMVQLEADQLPDRQDFLFNSGNDIRVVAE